MVEIEKSLPGSLGSGSKRNLKARKFYMVSPDFRAGGAPGWKLENEKLIKPKEHIILAGDPR